MSIGIDYSGDTTIALFPLRSVLFPRGRLSLQIFERRYIDLVASSLRDDSGFGVTLLKSGKEVVEPGTRQTLHRTGTYARIVDWDQLENGLLGITVEGVRKFHVEDCWVNDDDLFMARVIFSENDAVSDAKIPLQDEFSNMAELLQMLEQHPAIEEMQLDIDHENLWDLGWRLSELLPVDLQTRQKLLELDDPWERMRQIEQTVITMSNEA